MTEEDLEKYFKENNQRAVEDFVYILDFVNRRYPDLFSEALKSFSKEKLSSVQKFVDLVLLELNSLEGE
jgi:hypothetical protein